MYVCCVAFKCVSYSAVPSVSSKVVFYQHLSSTLYFVSVLKYCLNTKPGIIDTSKIGY